jgi:hypothetical protein
MAKIENLASLLWEHRRAVILASCVAGIVLNFENLLKSHKYILAKSLVNFYELQYDINPVYQADARKQAEKVLEIAYSQSGLEYQPYLSLLESAQFASPESNMKVITALPSGVYYSPTFQLRLENLLRSWNSLESKEPEQAKELLAEIQVVASVFKHEKTHRNLLLELGEWEVMTDFGWKYIFDVDARREEELRATKGQIEELKTMTGDSLNKYHYEFLISNLLYFSFPEKIQPLLSMITMTDYVDFRSNFGTNKVLEVATVFIAKSILESSDKELLLEQLLSNANDAGFPETDIKDLITEDGLNNWMDRTMTRVGYPNWREEIKNGVTD